MSTLRHVLEENYDDYVIAEAWAATYKRGDYAEGHTHEGWDGVSYGTSSHADPAHH